MVFTSKDQRHTLCFDGDTRLLWVLRDVPNGLLIGVGPHADRRE